MSKIGTLTPMPSGKWGILYDSTHADEISSGDCIYIEVAGSGALAETRIEYDHQKKRFYSIDGYPLRVNLRAERGEGMRLGQ